MIDRYFKIYQNRTPSKERATYLDENKENKPNLKNHSSIYDQSLGLRDPV